MTPLQTPIKPDLRGIVCAACVPDNSNARETFYSRAQALVDRCRSNVSDPISMSALGIMRLLRTRRCKLSDMATIRQGGSRNTGPLWVAILQIRANNPEVGGLRETSPHFQLRKVRNTGDRAGSADGRRRTSFASTSATHLCPCAAQPKAQRNPISQRRLSLFL